MPGPFARAAPGLLGLALLATGGCAGYQIGSPSLFRPDIRTVYVPMFESDSLRKYLGPQLKEAVSKQIESLTPYKVVHSPMADSTLTGRILQDWKRPIGKNVNDEPRVIGLDLSVQATWFDRSGQLLMQQTFELGNEFVPESGQSFSTAQLQTIQELAEQIVSRMERQDW